MTSLYDQTVPVLTTILKTEVTLLKKAEDFSNENGTPMSELISARLYPDMYPLSMQVGVTIMFSKRFLELVVGQPLSVDVKEYTLDECYAVIEKTLAALAEVKPESVNGRGADKLDFNIGKKYTSATVQDWYVSTYLCVKFSCLSSRIRLLTVHNVSRFLIPTVFFHLTTLYDILRMKGVPLAKMNYLTHFLDGLVLC
ncbi:hypothetical protein M426DRAFT_263508 [Hypoxylon sp. CI-4A]|nr:hypothetical protein M426DRAFT_263508 [Hypoxylon sp. CI-4A]